jgi:hypothetical protein
MVKSPLFKAEKDFNNWHFFKEKFTFVEIQDLNIIVVSKKPEQIFEFFDKTYSKKFSCGYIYS